MPRARALVVCALLTAATSALAVSPALAVPTTPAPAPSPTVPPTPGAPGGSTPGTGLAPLSADDTAIAQARASGVPVEVVADRSPLQQIFAQPDGTLIAQLSAAPVRVQAKDGSWAPVDTTLRSQPGAIVPAKTVPDLSFGAGGSTTLVRLELSGKALILTWPTTLPAPTLTGSIATYAEVLPGVDLRLQAGAEGFSEQLVVKTAAAASNPALRTVRFGLTTAGGLTVRTAADGSLTAVDTAGGTVFQAPAPAMWDTATAPDALAAGLPGPHRAAVGATVVGANLELTPDPAVLSAPDLSFPLVIDPSWTTKGPAWTEVNSFDPNSATWRTVPTSLALGFQDFQSPNSRVRSFIRFPISSTIYGSQIRSSTLRLFENWSSSCTKTAMQVWSTGAFSGATTWNHQPAFVTLQGSATDARGHDAGCPAANLEFPVTNAVARAAAAHAPVTLGLKATNENDHLAWKKFQIDGTTPQLTIVYNRPPRTPVTADLHTSNPSTGCGNFQVNAQNGVLLQVRASDPDGDKVRVNFSFTHVGGSTITTLAAPITSGGATSWQVAGPLAEGQTYTWRAYVRDVDANGTLLSSSGWSPTCTLVQNGTRPNPPQISSRDYPENVYAGGGGHAGSFFLSRSSAADVDVLGYNYGLDDPSPTTFVAGAAVDKTATVTATPSSWGPHDLWVQTKDTAGNLSTALPYHFYVQAPSDPVGYWKYDETSGTRAPATVEADPAAAAGPAVDGTLTGAASWTTGRLDGAVHTDGVTGYVSSSAQVSTAADLTVSAWVRLSAKGRPMTIVSEESTGISGFLLQYRPEQDRFAFTMPQQDATSTFIDVAWSTSPVPLNTWTHLTGVYWKAQQKIGVYVNGTLEGTAAHTLSWESTGGVIVGRGRAGGTAADFWPGDADEVRVYKRSLADAEIADIVNHTKPGPLAMWRMDDPASATTAADTSGFNHPLTKGTGNSFVAAGHDLGAMSYTGANPSTAAPIVDTTKTFSVAAWLRPTVAGTKTAVSQAGPTGVRFALAARADGKWVFNATTADGAHVTYGAASTTVVAVNQWTFLAATWDATAGTSKLYVNGRLEATVAAPLSWNATTSLLVGSSKGAGVAADKWTGQIDEVRVFDRGFYAGEPSDLYRDGHGLASAAAPDGRWHLDEAAGATVAGDSSGRNRPATLSGQAAFTATGGHAGGALELSVTRDVVDPNIVTAGGTAATANPATRTDRSFAISVWVRLDDADREQAIVSQDGMNGPGYSLSYVPDNLGQWIFTLPAADVPGSGEVSEARVPAIDTVGAWVHLYAEYDSFTHRSQLWVIDSFTGTNGIVRYGDQPTGWHATGPMRFGRDRTVQPDAAGDVSTVVDGDYLAGALDEVTLYTGSLSAGDRKSVLGQ